MESSIIRNAQKNDTSDLAFFLNQARYVHRHLDWRPVLDWLGEDSFWILEQDHQIQAAFACPDDPPGIAWVRLFACSSQISPDDAWTRMFLAELDRSNPNLKRILAAISLHDWFMRLLQRHGWIEYQQIVTLVWDGAFPEEAHLPDGAVIRSILPEDLPEITRIDNLAFEPLWRLSLSALNNAYEQSAFATLMEINDQIIAYQMSTATSFNAHLARLAVLPQLQGQRIGYTLVYDLLRHLDRLQLHSATVNTQHDNLASQALYQRLGFIHTDEHFPVLVYQD
ncbi:MAG TPA: GNAT family N-acetyltransferase [Longilinea sp.]|nr:GNAT family N-acetyltransferase [Longilinea sp.]